MSDILMFEELIKQAAESNDSELSLTLPFDKRQKSRFRAQLNNGDEIGVVIERGSVLRGGDGLRSGDGQIVLIISADESVSTIHCDNAHDLAHAAYHLGNRHVPLQVGDKWLRYLKDHVLDEMVEGFGLSIQHEAAPFEPEIGAYHSHGVSESHSHRHTHDHHH